MDESNKMIVQLTVSQLAEIVEAAVDKAIAKKKPPRLQFTTEEAAAMLGVPATWLASKARAGEIPCRRMGHYRNFSLQDIEQIMERFRVEGKTPKKPTP